MRFQSLDPLIAFAPGLEFLDLLLGLVLGDSVGVLEAAGKLVAVPGDLVLLIVGQASPLLANLALELLPVAFDAVPIHGVTWLENGFGYASRRIARDAPEIMG
jgi:hypothetical protein